MPGNPLRRRDLLKAFGALGGLAVDRKSVV